MSRVIIPNTQGCYTIDKEGVVHRIKGMRNWKGQTPPHKVESVDNGNGYRYVNLKGKLYYIHRLVAVAFLPNPDDHGYVGHKDHNKENNKISNLYWTTSSTNTKDGIRDGRINYPGRINGKMLYHSDEIIVESYRRVTVGESLCEVAREMGINRTTLSSWVNKRSKSDVTDKVDETLNNP